MIVEPGSVSQLSNGRNNPTVREKSDLALQKSDAIA
mgnify:FL=1